MQKRMATADFSSGKTFEYKCTAVCGKKNLVKMAVKACQDCKKQFCTSCLEVHYSLHDDHNIVEPSVLLSPMSKSLQTEECKKHAGKRIDVWCVQHDVVGCVRCAFFEHRSCEMVKDIPTDIKDIFKQEDYDSVMTELNSNLEYLKGRQYFLNREKENLSVEKNTQLTKIEQHAHKLISMIKTSEEKSKEEVIAKFKEIEDKIEEVADKCKAYEEKIRHCLQQLYSSTVNKPQTFITMKRAQQTIKLSDKNCRVPVVGINTVVFKSDSSTEQQFAGPQSLGNCSNILRKYEVKDAQEIDVELRDDSEECSINGSCLLTDGSFVVTDSENKKLKRVEISSSSVIDSCKVPGEPYGVCCVGQELAVALSDQKIQFVTLESRMTLSRTIDVDHNCCGMAYHNGELYVSDCYETIYVYNLEGLLLRTLSNITSCNCTFLTVSSDGENVFSGCVSGGLVCTDRLGNHLYTKMYENIEDCYGVCRDNKSSLFICGYESDNVVQLSEGGEQVVEIVNSSHGVCSPNSLCFDTCRQRLLVTQDSNIVLAFELVSNYYPETENDFR